MAVEIQPKLLFFLWGRCKVLRTEEEVKEAIKDFTKIPFTEFCKKYRVDTMREGVGFVKALRWVLELV